MVWVPFTTETMLSASPPPTPTTPLRAHASRNEHVRNYYAEIARATQNRERCCIVATVTLCGGIVATFVWCLCHFF